MVEAGDIYTSILKMHTARIISLKLGLSYQQLVVMERTKVLVDLVVLLFLENSSEVQHLTCRYMEVEQALNIWTLNPKVAETVELEQSICHMRTCLELTTMVSLLTNSLDSMVNDKTKSIFKMNSCLQKTRLSQKELKLK